MEEMHRTHKEPAWGWIGVVLTALTDGLAPIQNGSPPGAALPSIGRRRPYRMKRLRSAFFARSPIFSRTASPSKATVWPDRSEALKLVSSSTRSSTV